ncbi:MAG TPA: hypothetical protein VGQ44_08275 [Gemmatimonadaceae bacterium]|jgi:hypothetical protein|nr:hypothetical protein [Gemmatimonadaceae bacterium]
MTKFLRTVTVLSLVARALTAQSAGADPRLVARLDKPTYVAVNAIVDSARAAKLPTAPLVDKALEGAAKGSDGPKIVTAVKQLSVRMTSARAVLGTSASSDEIKAASTAFEAGVSDRDLARVKAANGKRPVTMPLAVITDLIGLRIEVATATNLVIQLEKSGVKDGEFALFQRNVRADIDRGADPTVAAQTRARGLLQRGASTGKPSESSE